MGNLAFAFASVARGSAPAAMPPGYGVPPASYGADRPRKKKRPAGAGRPPAASSSDDGDPREAHARKAETGIDRAVAAGEEAAKQAAAALAHIREAGAKGWRVSTAKRAEIRKIRGLISLFGG